jgi:hypothetical protein
VLRVREGDRVRLAFRNRTDAHSSLHLHGLPIGPDVDRPLQHLLPGEQDEREFVLPAGSAGTSWYHPHAHGDVERQLLAGLAGAVVVTGPVDELPGLAEADDRLVMITRRGRDLVVNGALHPLLTASAGRVRLRLLNATAGDVLRLGVRDADGGRVELQQLAADTGLLERPEPVPEVLLPPGGRAEVTVDARPDAPASRLRLTALPYSANTDGSGAGPARTLLSIDLPAGRVPAAAAAAAGRGPRARPGPGRPDPADRAGRRRGRRLHGRRSGLRPRPGRRDRRAGDPRGVGGAQRAHRRPPVPPAQLPLPGAGRRRHAAAVPRLARHGRRPGGQTVAWPSPSPAGRGAPSTTATWPRTRTSA